MSLKNCCWFVTLVGSYLDGWNFEIIDYPKYFLRKLMIDARYVYRAMNLESFILIAGILYRINRDEQ